jgi:hypothetical protein
MVPMHTKKFEREFSLNRWRDERTRTVPAVPRLREAVVAPLAFICEERRPYQLRFMAGMRDLGIVEAPQSQTVRDSDEVEVAAVVAPLASSSALLPYRGWRLFQLKGMQCGNSVERRHWQRELRTLSHSLSRWSCCRRRLSRMQGTSLWLSRGNRKSREWQRN